MNALLLIYVLNMVTFSQQDTSTLGSNLMGFFSSKNDVLFRDTMAIEVYVNHLLPYQRYRYNNGMLTNEFNSRSIKEDVEITLNTHYLFFFFLKDIQESNGKKAIPSPYQIDLDMIKEVYIDENQLDISLKEGEKQENLRFYFINPNNAEKLYNILGKMQKRIKFELSARKKFLKKINVKPSL